LKNWRPISLLSIVYKLATTVIANRIKAVLDLLIHEDQKGFIKGRFIGENIRETYDILFEARERNIPGMLVLIDFEKAFDSVSWKFIQETLTFFNFGKSIKKWIDVFYNRAESSVIQNGHMSEFFSLERGCRQGDPLSPYLFLLCVEIMGIMVRENKKIKGLHIDEIEHKISQYADDTELFLDGEKQSLVELIKTLQQFYALSGLKMNMEKTNVIWIGSRIGSPARFCEELKFRWCPNVFTILGVNFNASVQNMWGLNSDNKLLEIQRLFTRWKLRGLTLLGKITVIKSLAISKLTHLLIALPNPPGHFIQELNKTFYKFLWNGGPDRVKREVLCKNYHEGGLKMVEITTFINSLKLSWIKRYFGETKKWQRPLDKIAAKYPFIWKFGANYLYQTVAIHNPFWKDVLHAWNLYCTRTAIKTVEDIINEPLWFNSNFNNSDICIFHWARHGILSIKDILDLNTGSFLDFQVVKERFEIAGTYLDYERVTRNIPTHWVETLANHTLNSDTYIYHPTCNTAITNVLIKQKGCRRFYEVLSRSR
jgi:hypothetical protein